MRSAVNLMGCYPCISPDCSLIGDVTDLCKMYLCTRDEIDEYFPKAKDVLHGITSSFLEDCDASLSTVRYYFFYYGAWILLMIKL
jgi:hypothetical protein